MYDLSRILHYISMNTSTLTLTIQHAALPISFNEHFAHLMRINQAIFWGALEHYRSMGLTYVDVPEIVGITGACENVDTLFRVSSRLGLPLFFAQTGQLSLEQALQSVHGACTIIHSGRDEEEEDARHLRQFRLTEEEFDSTFISMTREHYDEDAMFEELLRHVQATVQAMIRNVFTASHDILHSIYKRDISKLKKCCVVPFHRIRYEEAVRLLQTKGFPALRFGDDLKSEHEATVVALLNQEGDEIPVFITHYPKEIKFFNMKVSSRDSRVVLSADCVFPYAGEGVGSAVREHDFTKLNERLLTSTMYELHVKRGGTYEDFGWYLDIIKNQLTQPHAGYGIGNERVLQYIFGEQDIRRVSLFSLLALQTRDWERK